MRVLSFMYCGVLALGAGISQAEEKKAQDIFQIRELTTRDLILDRKCNNLDCKPGPKSACECKPKVYLSGGARIIFDPRSALVISVDRKKLSTYASTGKSEELNEKLSLLKEELKTVLPNVRKWIYRKGLTQAEEKELSRQASLAPATVVDIYTKLGLTPSDNLFNFNPVDGFEKTTEALILDLIEQITRFVTVCQVTGTVTQSREYRYGRTYPATAFTAVTVTEQDKKGLEAITDLKLKESASDAYEEAKGELEKDWGDKVKKPLDALDAKIPRLETAIRGFLDNLQVSGKKLSLSQFSNMTEYEKLKAEFQNSLDQITSVPAGLNQDLKNLKDGFDNFTASSLPTKVIGLLKFYGLLQRIDNVAVEQFSTVLGIGEAILIGNSVSSMGPYWTNEKFQVRKTVPLTIATNDELSITLEGIEGNMIEGKFVPSYQTAPTKEPFEAAAFQIGHSITRTYALSYLFPGPAQEGTAAPSLNVHWKKYGRERSLSDNRVETFGFGFSIFPLSVDQNKSGINQTFAGPSFSFFDDWLTVGYGRNFSLGTWSPFVGISIPFRLGG
jgi:hypothetical protein